VIRILGGKDQQYSVSNLHSIIAALGTTIYLAAPPAEQFNEAATSVVEDTEVGRFPVVVTVERLPNGAFLSKSLYSS
jgi:hypothetical protein